MDRPRNATPAALKAQLIAQLDTARRDLSAETSLARAHLSPTAVIGRSFTEHRVAWLGVAAVTGVALVRLVLPAKNRSDKKDPPAKTRGLRGLLGTLAKTVAKRAAMNFATTHFKDSAAAYLESLISRQR